MADSEGTAPETGGGETRRDFLDLLTGGFVVAGVAAAAWPFIQQMNPAADTLAASTTEVDLAPIEEGQSITVIWQGKPPWLVVVGICTHLGCIPKGQRTGERRGDFGGWFCPCHGSHYDTSGRIRKGPAPDNLPVPGYKFLSDTVIRIG